MKALVEPFPLVPAIWMGRIALSSEGYEIKLVVSPYYASVVYVESHLPGNQFCAAIQSFQE